MVGDDRVRESSAVTYLILLHSARWETEDLEDVRKSSLLVLCNVLEGPRARLLLRRQPDGLRTTCRSGAAAVLAVRVPRWSAHRFSCVVGVDKAGESEDMLLRLRCLFDAQTGMRRE